MKKGYAYNVPYGTEVLREACFAQTHYLSFLIIPETVNSIDYFLYSSSSVKNVTIFRKYDLKGTILNNSISWK